jgi:hypothetical protein
MTNLEFRVVCISCWQATKYEALTPVKGLLCDKCGETL